MAKQSAKLNNYSGGIDLATSERDIESNECVDARNVSLYRPGLLILGHKAIESNLITGSSLLECGVFGSGFHASGREAWVNQELVSFSSSQPFGNTFAANYGAGMTGVTVANHNIKTTSFSLSSPYVSNYGVNNHTFGAASEFHENFENYITPSVDWVIGNEMPKPGRSLFGISFQHEWCRWHYEVNTTKVIFDAENKTVIDAGTGGQLYRTAGASVHDASLEWRHAATRHLNYPISGSEAPFHLASGEDWDDSKYWDMAKIQNPNRFNSALKLNGGSTSGNGFCNSGVSLHVAPKMSLRFDRMMSGSTNKSNSAAMGGMLDNASGDHHATRLRPSTWYDLEIRYFNPTNISCNTFGLAYDQTLMYDFDTTNGGYTNGILEEMISQESTFLGGVDNLNNITGLKGDKCYNWLDVDASTNNGENPENLKFAISANTSNGYASIRFKTKAANYVDDWSMNLASTYFSLCFSKMLKINAAGTEASDIEEFMYFDSHVVASGLNNNEDFRAYISYLCTDVDTVQDKEIQSDLENIRNYSGEGDEYLVFSGKGTDYNYDDGTGTVKHNTKNSWLYSTAAGKWTQESNFEHTWKLGLYPNLISGKNGILQRSQRRDWLAPFHVKHDSKYNTWTEATDEIKIDSYFSNNGLRLKDTTTWYDYGVYFGHIKKHMYYGAKNYWDTYNSNNNGDWDLSIGAWKESAWFLLDKRFNPPEPGRFTFDASPLAVKDGEEWFRPPLHKKRYCNDNPASEYELAPDGYQGGKLSDRGAWFPEADMHRSGTEDAPLNQGKSNLDCNGHDINVRMQFNTKGYLRNGAHFPTSSEINAYDETMSDSLKHKTSFGISYLYDGVRGIKFEDGPEQETSIVIMRYPPYLQDEIDGGDGQFHIYNKTFLWRPENLTYAQPFRISWSHGPRYHRANPRLSGFRIYMKQHDEGEWGDWGLLSHISFVDGKYNWYGQGTDIEQYILEMTTATQDTNGHLLDPLNSSTIGMNGNTNMGGVDAAFNNATNQTNWYDDKEWNDKSFNFPCELSSNGEQYFHLIQNTFSDPFAACAVDLGALYTSDVDVDDWIDYKAFGVYGEYWSTGVHKLSEFPTSRIYSAMHSYKSESLEWIPRYKCSTILRNRVFIGNIYDDSGWKTSRVIVSPVDKYDTFSMTEYLDYEGALEDDPIIQLENFNNKLIVLKRYSVHVVDNPEPQEIKSNPFAILEYNGIRNRSHAIKSNKGVAWFNKYGLWFFDGKKVENLLLKDITIAEGVTVNKKRIPDEIWRKYFSNDKSFITYDSEKEQIICGSNLGELDEELTDENDRKVEFVYDFVTKGFTRGASMFTNDIMCVPVLDKEGVPTFFKTSSEDGSLDVLGDSELSETAYMRLDNDLENSITRDVLLITKDLDFRDPSKRKKFYKVYITFKANQYYQFEQPIETYNQNFEEGSHKSEHVWNSKVKVYYALNGTKDWKEFDFAKSVNYTDIGSTTTNEGEHGLVIWEDTEQATSTLTLQNNIAANTFYDTAKFTGDKTDVIISGMALKINNEVLVVDYVTYNPNHVIDGVATPLTEVFFLQRGLNSTNPNASGDSVNNGPDAMAAHSEGDTVYVLTNNWSQATLVPPATDTYKNSFYSIQFKIESVESSDGTKRFVPSRFEINDINIIYREKSLR